MILRPAVPGDEPAIEAFLRGQEQTSMLTLANLADHGLTGSAPMATRFWLQERNGRVIGALGLTQGGMLLPQLPHLVDWRPVMEILRDKVLIGAVGSRDQTRACLAELGLAGLPTRQDVDEPGYVLSLDRLEMPDHDGMTLCRPTRLDVGVMIHWRSVLQKTMMGTPADKCRALAKRDVLGFLERDSHRLLYVNGQPVAMTGVSSRLSDVVQVSGVYTPPAFRGRGYARCVVAMHLDELRGQGILRASLFAANHAAAKAYRALGFTRRGDIAMVVFDTPQSVAHRSAEPARTER